MARTTARHAASAGRGGRRELGRRSAGGVTRAVLVVLLALAAPVVLVSNCSGTPYKGVASSTDWQLVWSDEFNGPAGAPSSANWKYDTGGDGWGNEELQYYTDQPENAAVDGQGNLMITARPSGSGAQCWYGPCQYTSARLTTQEKFSQQYGYFEARIRVPRGQGMWPAFWMLGNNLDSVGWPTAGEIDVMENVGKAPGSVYGTLHGPGDAYANQDVTGEYTLPSGQAFADDFHVFAVEWTPMAISWYVDGLQYETRTKSELGDGWVFDQPFFMLVNLAVGGRWPGSPDAATQLPQQMAVDYVRVYRSTR